MLYFKFQQFQTKKGFPGANEERIGQQWLKIIAVLGAVVFKTRKQQQSRGKHSSAEGDRKRAKKKKRKMKKINWKKRKNRKKCSKVDPKMR